MATGTIVDLAGVGHLIRLLHRKSDGKAPGIDCHRSQGEGEVKVELADLTENKASGREKCGSQRNLLHDADLLSARVRLLVRPYHPRRDPRRLLRQCNPELCDPQGSKTGVLGVVSH